MTGNRKKPPKLVAADGRVRRVFIVTRWSKLESGRLLAHEKFDATDQFETVARHLGWTPPKRP